MKTGQLLNPRFKVIADYPDSPFIVGYVIACNEKSEWFTGKLDWVTEMIPGPNGTSGMYSIKKFEPFPRIFRPMAWWEERQESEMPQYVRYGELNKRHAYYKIKELHLNGHPEFMDKYPCAIAEYPEDYFLVFRAEGFYPATEQEYNTHIKATLNP